jgi:uncharacterized protein YbjQ (UPF0145 family)
MIITTTMEVPGKKVAKNLGKDIVAGLRNIIGGELKEYTEMLSEARMEAIRRMEGEASKRGADAVIGVRLTTATVSHASAELLAYGTAVKLK